jgi:hypothetical protein
VNDVLIDSTEDLIARIRAESVSWSEVHPRWFRGEPDVETRLVPKLYRVKPFPTTLTTISDLLNASHDVSPRAQHIFTPRREVERSRWRLATQRHTILSAPNKTGGASRRESRMVASHGIESKERLGRHRFLRRR